MPENASQRATAGFARRFHQSPEFTLGVAGRIEILGNHTDYNQGIVLASAIDRQITLAARDSTDGSIVLQSESERRIVRAHPAQSGPVSGSGWPQFVHGMIHELQAEGQIVRGIHGYLASDIPPGGGLSSSAALLVTLAIALGNLPFRTHRERLALARLCQRVEHRWLGVHCGLLDYLTILHGTKNAAVQIDFRSEKVRPMPLPRGCSWILSDSGVRHRLSGGGYNEIRRAATDAAAALDIPSLRELSKPILRSKSDLLTPRQLAASLHVWTENQRVKSISRSQGKSPSALRLGKAMAGSHESSATRLQNSIPELDLLVRLSLNIPGCFGARLTGGGFGGWCLHLVQTRRVASFCAELKKRWKANRMPSPLRTEMVHPVGGVELQTRRFTRPKSVRQTL